MTGWLAIRNRTMTNHTNDFFSVTRNRPSTCFFAREMSNERFVRRNDRFVSGKFLSLRFSVEIGAMSEHVRNFSSSDTKSYLFELFQLRKLYFQFLSFFPSFFNFQSTRKKIIPYFSFIYYYSPNKILSRLSRISYSQFRVAKIFSIFANLQINLYYLFVLLFPSDRINRVAWRGRGKRWCFHKLVSGREIFSYFGIS